MNINELKRERTGLVAQAKAVQAQLSDEDIEYTDEQREKLEAKQDTLLAKVEEIDGQIADAEAKAEESRKRAERLAQLDNQPEPRAKTTPQMAKQPDITGGEPRFTKDPNKGFDSPREFFGKVMAYRGSGKPDDERLAYLATAGTDEQIGDSNPYGGFLIPEGMSPDLLSVPAEPDPFAGRLMNVPMDSPTLRIPARVDKDHSSSVSGGLTVSRSAETASKTASRMQLEQVKLEASSLYGYSYATEELLRDSPRSVIALLDAGFRDEFRSKRIGELLSGTGVNEPEGVQNSPALVTVAKETGQAADTIVYNNAIKMRSRCWGYQNAVWLYNHDALPQLMQLTLPVGTGGVAMWQTSAREGEPDMLLGRPAFATEYTETVGDLHDIMLINPTQILYGLYQPLETAESIHVRFDRSERAFKIWLRDDARGWWRSALTPKNSTNTLSPFVTLAARA